MRNIFFALFLVSVTGVITGIIIDNIWFDYLCKPLIMISIGGYFFSSLKISDKKIIRFALLAFIFSLAGDTFLMFIGKGMNYFISGLASFLVAQTGYTFLFIRSVVISGKSPYLRRNPFWLIGYLVYGGVFYFILLPKLDSVLKVAVLIYVVAILTMSAAALNRYKTVKPASFLFVLAGSLLFIFSDSLIATNKFLVEIPNDRLLIMVTYMAAQFLIAVGILKQFE